MASRSCTLSLAVVLSVLQGGHPQTPAVRESAKTDYSKEAAVIEEMSTKIAFDSDGNSIRDQSTRVRVQTDAGVQHWGLLTFPYQAANQTVEIDYVRVRKADGSTLATPPDNVQDLDAEVTRNAPFYSDLREKHVAVKGLGKGDILEYAARWHTTKTLIPGEFWFQYSFHHNGIVLNERLEIKVPRERVIKVKGPQATQTITTDEKSRTYAWTYSKLQEDKETENDQKRHTEAVLGRLPPPDVQISSFQAWEEVGRWYWNLQKERVTPTAAIRAKAEELTKGMTDDAAKLQAIYNFVSLQYRYIGVAFGIGRYQPHPADDVLSNNYGDCKDKHTLLASLLQASGIALYPALINSAFQLDPDVPSPGQFDHIIGYLPQGNAAVWLDTTSEVGPLGYLAPPLRDKTALVMSKEKSVRMVTTPSDPPFSATETFKIDGKLSDDGTFEAKIEDTSRGDQEVRLRSAFRRIPQPQWKELVQQISYAMGYSGVVSEVNASTPERTNEPFHFSYSYNRKDFPDWSNRQFTVAGLPFYMPPVKDDAKYPIWLGSPFETVSDSKVELPKGFKPQVPSNVDLKYDFAEYHASYSEDKGALLATRRLLIKLHEVPVAELDDYRSFCKNLQNDVNQYVTTLSTTTPATGGDTSAGTPLSSMSGIGMLPQSTSTEANQLEAEARDNARLGKRLATVTGFKRVVEADPKFTRAWVELAIAYMGSGQSDSALDALRKAIGTDPAQVIPRKIYVSLLTFLHKTDAAIAAGRDLVKIAPQDPEVIAELTALLMQQKRYREAIPYLETAAKNNDSAAAQTRLGTAYLKAGEIEMGTATLQKLVDASPTPVVLNDVAYELADANTALPRALEYAQRAVDQEEKESHDVDVTKLVLDDLARTRRIGSFWDTLGWIYLRLGRLDQAESYLYSAWLLLQNPVSADHLGQVYEQQKLTAKAIHMYRLALSTPEAKGAADAWDETRQRLTKLTGAKAPTPMELLRSDPNGSELSQLRSVKLRRLVPGPAEADVFLLFGPGPKVEGVEFINGAAKMRLPGATQALAEAKFYVAFPEGSSARLVRRAIVMCSNVSGCQVVLYTPNSVNSVN